MADPVDRTIHGMPGTAELARYVMIGGFLGAGKTTAVARLARHITDRGRRVGLICNDQSSGLVDTTLLRSKGFPVEEITGGCFCCRFNSLLEAAESLTRDSRPDLFLRRAGRELHRPRGHRLLSRCAASTATGSRWLR